MSVFWVTDHVGYDGDFLHVRLTANYWTHRDDLERELERQWQEAKQAALNEHVRLVVGEDGSNTSPTHDPEGLLRKALRRIAALQARWDAPVRHERGDLGEAAWAAVGSEATKIARDALSNSFTSPTQASAEPSDMQGDSA